MWYILDIQEEVFTMSKGGKKTFQTTIMGARIMNTHNIQALLQAACDAQDASEISDPLDLTQLIGARVSSIG